MSKRRSKRSQESRASLEESSLKPSSPERASLLATLRRLDELLAARVELAQELYGPESRTDAFRGLYISRADVERLLAREPGAATLYAPDPTGTAGDAGSRLTWLAQAFSLTPFDLDLILIAVAPDVDLKYERLYAYLQDDVTRRRPTVDLALNLLCPTADAKLQRRVHFAPDAPLLQERLLQLVADPHHVQPPLLAQYLRLDEQVVNLLLGQGTLDRRLASFCELRDPSNGIDPTLLADESKAALVTLAAEARIARRPLRLHFHGPHGVGKRDTAEALAASVGARLLVANLTRAGTNEQFEEAIVVLLREAWFQDAVVFVHGIDALRGERPADFDRFVSALARDAGITILTGTSHWRPSERTAIGILSVPFIPPGVVDRRRLWEECTASAGASLETTELDLLAERFRLTPVQITDAVATGMAHARWRTALPSSSADPSRNDASIFTAFVAAARGQCGHDLAKLAHKVEPIYTWDDLVLPADATAQLHEICQRVRYRHRVFEEWGFGRKLSSGKGVNALFAGPSGTGKTMAAEVIANDLELDLYKIDLSGVVSKYIGETEKNLDRIFTAAENANVILFFDEADALFGKRSEVRDSHDRYANIEISYLLQKVEQYEGIAILATNLRANLDEAFIRRLTFTVHFPFPDAASIRRIWAGIWPPETLLAERSDIDSIAHQFTLSGGNIKNIALAAAFFAANDGGTVSPPNLLQAVRREFQKLGKTLPETKL